MKAMALCFTAVVTIVLGTEGCTSHAPPKHAYATRLTSRSTRLDASEIAASGESTAYDALERLRPMLLRSIRTSSDLHERIVYLDGLKLGGIEQLRNIAAAGVAEIRAVNGIEATALFGTGNSAGAIIVTSKPQP
jgi:hypothetical protein